MPLLVGLAHVAAVAPHYFVGSFDDDSSYILAARALISGKGLTGHMPGGSIVAGVYPPGYPALLAPLVWVWPHTFVPLRLLSVACYVAVFILTWVYLGRRRLGTGTRTAVLFVLALGPPLATYGSMVMAETPYLVLLLVLLLLFERWDSSGRVLSPAGVGVVLSAAGLIWLKEAGVALVAGAVLWLLLRRSPRTRLRAAMLAGGTAALLVPIAVARLAGAVPLLGARYSQELGAYYSGGLVDRIVHVVPHAFWHLLSTALPATMVPYLSPLPVSGWVVHLWIALSWLITVLVVVGAVVWFRRHRDAAILMVPAYLAETLLWPYVNERRVILVLPVLVAWFVLGGKAVWDLARQRRPAAGWPRTARAGAAILTAAVVVVPLAFQFPRDYLFQIGQSSSHFEGSRYVAILRQLGSSSDVVETDYMHSIALFTGHRTADTAFVDTVTTCYIPGALADIQSDGAGYLLLGDVNKPGLIDSPCLLSATSTGSWAVRLLSTERDHASVYELIGPGTAHPDLQDLTAGADPVTSLSAGTRTIEWNWGAVSPVSQVSAGEVAGAGGAIRSVTLQLQLPGGGWRTIASAPSAVGDGAAPYLLAGLPAGTLASAMRLVVDVPAGAPPVAASDVHALGAGGSG